ncbi:MAG TPA: alpha/beta hydrolase, partial [Chitinophagaceae bacterium]
MKKNRMRRAALLLAGWLAISSASKAQAVIPLWKNGAPGFENLKDQPEQAKDWWVRDINYPTLTVFPAPKEIANGSAAIVCPGGGFTNLVY